MAGKEISLGPTGETVRENVARFRMAAGFSFAELSRRLEAVGRPLAPLGLRRIEAGVRRVDVDDLMALAVVLGVHPPALLMPQYSGHGIRREITGLGSVKTDVAWHWVRTSGGLMKAHEDDMPSMTLGGLSQYSEPTIVRTNAERQRTRAWYVGERVRAMDEGRAWQMTAVGGHAVQPRDGYEPVDDPDLTAQLTRLLDLDLSDDEAWASAEYDPAPPHLSHLNNNDDDRPDDDRTAREVLRRRDLLPAGKPTRDLRPIQWDNG